MNWTDRKRLMRASYRRAQAGVFIHVAKRPLDLADPMRSDPGVTFRGGRSPDHRPRKVKKAERRARTLRALMIAAQPLRSPRLRRALPVEAALGA
jgi:hypothetical protein